MNHWSVFLGFQFFTFCLPVTPLQKIFLKKLDLKDYITYTLFREGFERGWDEKLKPLIQDNFCMVKGM